jgi:NAD(P)-dependent dehydrogenase (short-subunit alcohol dehydrogenase family)
MNEGYFATPDESAYIEAMPAQRIVRLEELIAPLLLLASDAGIYVNGIALTVDGAHSLGHV